MYFFSSFLFFLGICFMCTVISTVMHGSLKFCRTFVSVVDARARAIIISMNMAIDRVQIAGVCNFFKIYFYYFLGKQMVKSFNFISISYTLWQTGSTMKVNFLLFLLFSFHFLSLMLFCFTFHHNLCKQPSVC